MSAHNATATNPPSRSIPQWLLDAAVAAIRHGAQMVNLGFDTSGPTYPEPIGYLPAPVAWTLVVRLPGEDFTPRRQLSVPPIHHRIGWMEKSDALPARIRARSDHPVDEHLVELFLTAVQNGWDVSYSRSEEAGTVTLSAASFHWTYDADKAAAAGEQLIDKLVLIGHEGGQGLEAAPVTNDRVAWYHRNDLQIITRDAAEQLLRAPAPFTQPVAYLDTDTGVWVL